MNDDSTLIDTWVWKDPAFRALSSETKVAYFALLSHPFMKSAGVEQCTTQELATALGYSHQAILDAIEFAGSQT